MKVDVARAEVALPAAKARKEAEKPAEVEVAKAVMPAL
jgi:hypothetical protein